MQSTNLLKKVAAAALVASAGSAMADPISVAFNFIPFLGSLAITSGGPGISTATGVGLTGGSYVINQIDTSVATNNIGVVPALTINLTNPLPLTMGATFEKSFTVGNITFIESLTVNTVDTGPSSRSILAAGTISCTADVDCTFDDSPVYFSASYTQNQQGQINVSFNNSTVPPTNVPEPTSLALVGLALAGLGFGARRRAAK